jgi:Zn-finger protein
MRIFVFVEKNNENIRYNQGTRAISCNDQQQIHSSTSADYSLSEYLCQTLGEQQINI